MPARKLRILAFAAAYALVQVALITCAHFREDKAFGFQMFAESSRFTARLYRELRDGRIVAAAAGAWTVSAPGGRTVMCAWDDHVRDFRLGRLEGWRRAKTGLAVTLRYLERALEYVGSMTPEDREEASALQRQIGDALKAGDWGRLRAQAGDLADLLFYVEER